MKLVITEKKKQVEAFVEANIGWTMKGGYATRKLDGEEWRAVWSQGHLITLLTPDEVIPDLSWQSTDQLVPIPRDYPTKVIDDSSYARAGNTAKDRINRIEHHMKNADEVIIGTDSDREGEQVGWSILKHLGWNGPVRRLWLAKGLDPKSIQQAFGEIREPERTKAWARAAEARSRSDWSFMFGVRGFTFYSKYGKFGKALSEGTGKAGTFSIGRVQTPTLALVVRREEEIQNFVSRDHFNFAATFSPLGNEGSTIEAKYQPVVTKEVIEKEPAGVHWEPSKEPPNEKGEVPLDKPLFVGKEEVEAFEQRLRDASDKAKVSNYKESTTKSNPKKTYSLPDAQDDIGRALKIKGTLVQTILEDLYEQGYSSYGRTSKSELPINFHDQAYREDLLKAVSGIEELSLAAKTARDIHAGQHADYKPFTPAVYVNKELEHHGIVPTPREVNDASLKNMVPRKKNDSTGKVSHTSEMMQKAYLMLCKRYIHALLPPAQFATQSVTFTVPVNDMLGAEEAVFKASARRLLDPGYAAFFDTDLAETSNLPPMTNGDGAKILDVVKKASKTTPPPRYNTAKLMLAMENVAKEIRDPKLRKLLSVAEGLGTPATRSKVVDTLEARNFIKVDKNNYVPTQRGIDVIKHVPDWMSSPETSAVWEDFLSQICDQKDDNEALRMRDEFVEQQTASLEEIIQELKSKYDHDLGERVGGGGGITPKMKSAIEKIAALKGLELDQDTLKDPAKAKAFLNEHIGENAAPLPPSEKQLGLAMKIFNLIGGDVSKEDLEKSGKACSSYIDANLDKYRSQAKPSQAQIDFAKKLAEELPDDKKPDDKVFENAAECSKFIDEQTGGGKGKGGGKRRSSAGSKAGRSGRGGAPTRRRKKT